MTAEQIIGISLALLLMVAALIGSILPGLPGTPLALFAAIAHRLYFGEDSVSNAVLIALIIIAVIALVFDFAATMLGAKKFGATWRGALGAVIGGVAGLFFGPPGMILGPFFGATLFELLGDKEFKHALKAGTGAVIGLLLGVIGKFALCVTMMVLFATNVIYRSLQ